VLSLSKQRVSSAQTEFVEVEARGRLNGCPSIQTKRESASALSSHSQLTTDH